MINQKIIDAVKEYKDSSDRCFWIPLANILFEAQGKEDLSYLIKNGLSESSIKRLITAYGFLKIHRPDTLKPPYDQVQNSARAVSFLPTIYGLLPKETRNKDIQEYTERILSGSLTGNHVEVVVMRLKGNKQGINIGSAWTTLLDRKVSNFTLEEDELAIAGKVIDCFEDQIHIFIKKYGFEKLREHFSNQCSEIAVELNCISDPEYKKQRDSRKDLKKQETSSNVCEDDLDVARRIIDHFRYQIKYYIMKHGYEKLRKLYADLCDDVIVKLNCISDPEYKKQWDNRKESSV
jgi:hypothetical protein